MAEYKTIKQRASDEFVEKKSRFIGYISPVSTEEEAIEFINEIRTKHRDATHNVYAYSLRAGQIKRASDDGEPQGTAGMPVLDVLQKEGIYNVLCVVTRYFGGTLLGTGGLVRAYSKSAKLALEAAGVSRKQVWERVEIPCPYSLYEQVKNEIAAGNGMVAATDFGADVAISAIFPAADTERFLKRLTDLSSGRVTALRAGQEYKAFPINR